MLSAFCETFFHLLLREVVFSKFSTIFRKNIHFHFPVRIFTAPPVSPDMQNTPPNFEILAVYFEAKRWYINFVRTFCGQRTCIHAAVSKRRDNFDREVIGVFWYHCVMERLYHPLASPRVLHLTDGTETCGSSQMSPLTRCGSFAWPRAVPRASSIRLS